MMDPLVQAFLQYVRNERLFDKGAHLLVAASGGLDSTVLCHLCHTAGFSFSIAHCHFGLRGAESDRDAAFVRELAHEYGVPFYSRRFDTETFAREQKLSIQEAARNLRYRWFEELIAEPATYNEAPFSKRQIPNSRSQTPNPNRLTLIATAHHLDDNVETMLMNFFKGTGISGLRGMRQRQGRVVRPLLFARREELEQYALRNGLQWAEDSSNRESHYTRNFFRNELLPLIQTRIPQAGENLARNLRRFEAAESLYQESVARHLKKMVVQKGPEQHVPVLRLQQLKGAPALVWEMIRPLGFTSAQTDEVLHLLHSPSGRAVRSATHQVVRHRAWLIFAPLEEAPQQLVVVEGPGIFGFGNGVLEVAAGQWEGGALPEHPDTAVLDARGLTFPLILRRRKAGDYFYPLGLRKKKKVARFLIDQKVSKVDKEKVWVLESDQKIIWVVGHRIDDRFKVGAGTQNILKLRVNSKLPAG